MWTVEGEKFGEKVQVYDTIASDPKASEDNFVEAKLLVGA